jgi:4-amino-4-deoxy-L-arabinose transferase-like glycosyltransferase
MAVTMNEAHPVAPTNTEPARPSLLADWRISCLLVFAVALGLRLVHHHDAMKSPLWDHHLPMFDSRYYDKCAREIANGDLWGKEVFFMAPMYQYSLAMCYRVLTDDWAQTLLIQNFFGAASCAIICWIGRRLWSPAVGLIAGLLASTYGVFIYFDSLLLPYSQNVFLHLAAVGLMLHAADKSFCWRAWLLVGVLLGLCAIGHGTALTLVPGVLLWLWLDHRTRTRRQNLIASAVVILGCSAMVGSITLRNYIVGRDFVLLTSNAGMNLYQGNNADATGTHYPTTFPYKGAKMSDYYDGFKRGPGDLPPSEVSSRIARQAFEFMYQHPGQELKLIARKLRLLFNDFEIPINDHYYFFKQYSHVLQWPLPTFGLIAAVGLTGVLVGLNRWRTLFPIYLLLASQVFAYTATFVLSRYRLVLTASLILFAGAQIVAWIRWARAREFKPLAASIALCAGLCFWVYSPVDRFDQGYGLATQYAAVGRVYLNRGAYSEAETSLRKAIEADLSPYFGDDVIRQRADCHVKLAQAQEHMHRDKDAVENYTKALNLLDQLSKPGGSIQRDELKRAMRDAQQRANGLPP